MIRVCKPPRSCCPRLCPFSARARRQSRAHCADFIKGVNSCLVGLCRPSRSKDVEVHRATPGDTGCLSRNGGLDKYAYSPPRPSLLASRQSSVATRLVAPLGSRESGEAQSTEVQVGRDTPMLGLEFDGARDRAARDRGPRASLSPQAPMEATGPGGGGGRARRATYLVFSGPETDAYRW